MSLFSFSKKKKKVVVPLQAGETAEQAAEDEAMMDADYSSNKDDGILKGGSSMPHADNGAGTETSGNANTN